MYKLMIIDDEDTIRSGLADFIPWEELGFTVAAEFEDGQEAIDFLQIHSVDVVLTDIMMAEVSGLALAKYIYMEMPEIKVVLISGFKEFEYAQQAIQYNVNHYLLKPTKLEEIAEVFSQLKLELDKRKELEAEKKQSQEWQLLLQEQFIIDLLTGALRDIEDMEMRIGKIGLPIKAISCCCVIAIQIGLNNAPELLSRNEKDKVVRGLGKLFRNNAHAQVQFYPVNLPVQGLQTVAVFTEEVSADEGIRLTKRILHKIQRSMQEIFGVDVLLDIRSVYESLEELAHGDIECREPRDLTKLSKPMLDQAIKRQAEHKAESSAELIAKAQAYIWDHYGQDLSLESVASQVFLHPVYFSRLFKQYTKVNFTDYLTQIRIQKAIELLSEKKHKMYEIGERVGYTNSKYFYRVFKQVTGYTPKEYFRHHYGMRIDR